jgi:hypothetical protein
MIAPVLFILFAAQTHNSSLPAEPTTWQTTGLFEKWQRLACAKHISG